MKPLIRKYSVLLVACLCAGCSLPDPPECYNGGYKCEPNNETEGCTLHRCEYEQWVNVKPCLLGWNYDDYEVHADGACVTECIDKTYYCKPKGDGVDCDLYKCENENWTFDQNCQYGWNYEDIGIKKAPCFLLY